MLQVDTLGHICADTFLRDIFTGLRLHTEHINFLFHLILTLVRALSFDVLLSCCMIVNVYDQFDYYNVSTMCTARHAQKHIRLYSSLL